MRWLFLFCVLFSGCTSVLDNISTDYFVRNYFAEKELSGGNWNEELEPSIQNVLARNHDKRVKARTDKGWEILGSSEFTTSGSPRINHLRNLARKLGSTLVVYSSEFDRREQELDTRKEYKQGERITVNGTTVRLEGRWVDVVHVETRFYHNYRATLLREPSE